MTVPVSSGHSAHRLTVMLLSAVMGIAVVGFFVGINDGVPRADPLPASTWLATDSLAAAHAGPPAIDAADVQSESATYPTAVLPAVNYADMRRRQTGPTARWKQSLSLIPQPSRDPLAEIKPSPEAKQQSTLVRASRRAYNGAPPVIPHTIEGTDDSACYACHGQGMRIADRVANRMSHGFLANCTQCHAPPPPTPFAKQDLTVSNAFAGLPAPLAGERAFPGAPPTVPHSTWMREQCLACHGTEAGWAGLESTHPWRVNCQQCHAPSAALEQGVLPVRSHHE